MPKNSRTTSSAKQARDNCCLGSKCLFSLIANACHACVNELGVKVVEEPLSHNYDPMFEECKVDLPYHAKVQMNNTIEMMKTSH